MFGQQLPKIKGSGIVTLKEVEIEESFDSIDIDGDFEIELSQGNTSLYTIETDDNLIDVIQFRVEDNTLKISATHRIVKKKRFKITLTAATIAEIHLNNDARIKGSQLLKGDNILVTAGKSSEFDLDLDYKEAINLELFSDAKGSIKATAQNSKVTTDGRSNLKGYFLVESIEMELSDSSKFTMDGSIENATIKLERNGKLDAKEATLNTTVISLSETSDAYIQVKERIELYAQDSAILELYGDPEIVVTGLKNKAKILKKE